VVLVGILVNSGLSWWTYNQLRNIHGLPLKEAIMDGPPPACGRLLMTTLTTILAWSPFR